MKRILAIFLVCILSACLIDCGRSPKTTVRMYIKHSAEGNLVRAKDYLTEDFLAFNNQMEEKLKSMGIDPNQFTAEQMGVSWEDMRSEIELEQTEKSADSASVKVKIQMVSVTYKLIKENGQWKIDDIHMPFGGSIKNIVRMFEGIKDGDFKDAFKNMREMGR